jgi:hypothetical protein
MLRKNAGDYLADGMEKNLKFSEKKREAIQSLDIALQNVNHAMQLLDELKLYKQADSLLNVLVKLSSNDEDEEKIIDLLESEDMLNFADDGINELLVEDSEEPEYLNKSLKDQDEFNDFDFEDE